MPDNAPALDADEHEVIELINGAMGRINGWGLQHNHAELVQAVHVMQGFVVQHMLQRLNPSYWGQWYDLTATTVTPTEELPDAATED